MTLPPGPRAPGPVQLLRWVRAPEGLLRGCQERFGDQFTLKLAGLGPQGFNEVVFLTDPATIQRVFTGGAPFSRVAGAREPMKAMFGRQSVLVVDGETHLRQRKLLLPAFHGERLQDYAKTISEIAEREVASWQIGKPFSLQERMQALTLEVILRIVFGLDDAARRNEIAAHVKAMLDIVAHPLTELFMGLPGRIGPVNIRRGVERSIARADQALLAEIRTRRSDPTLEDRSDILSSLLLARDQSGNEMTDQELRDELVTLLLAGHETTATALAWTFECLFWSPEARERAVTDCQDPGSDGRYIDAVFKEVLRLRPPLPICDRVLEDPFEVGGYELPPGTIIAACIYLVHRRPDIYPQADAFLPDRFIDGTPESYAWLPFGGGMRRCIGASFAMLEMRIVLQTVLRQAVLHPLSDHPERVHRRAIVLAPKNGAQAVLSERLEPCQGQRAGSPGSR